MKVEYKEYTWEKAGSVPRGSVVERSHNGEPWIIGDRYHNQEYGCDCVSAIRLTDGYTDGFDVTEDVIVIDAKAVIG